MKIRKPNDERAKNDAENAKVFEDFQRQLYNNIDGTKYDPSILNEVEEYPEDKTIKITPTEKNSTGFE